METRDYTYSPRPHDYGITFAVFIQILEFIWEGQRIKAVKLIREHIGSTGLGLRDSLAIVNDLRDKIDPKFVTVADLRLFHNTLIQNTIPYWVGKEEHAANLRFQDKVREDLHTASHDPDGFLARVEAAHYTWRQERINRPI